MWLENLRTVDADLNGGRTEYDGEEFYGPVFAYLDRFNAPAAVRAVVGLRHGLVSRDFQAAASAADRLLIDAAHERGWIAPSQLLEGAVTAKLMLGDVAGADSVWAALARYSPPGWNLKTKLLEAHLTTAKAQRDRNRAAQPSY